MRNLIRISAGISLLAWLASGSVMAATETSVRPTLAGSYLAGHNADISGDWPEALKFYAQALRLDPQNAGLVERMVLISVMSADWEGAHALATRLLEIDNTNPAASTEVAVHAIKSGKLGTAQAALNDVQPGTLTDIISGLTRAWIQYDTGHIDAALATLTALKGPEWYGVFTAFHTAMILDAAGREDEALSVVKTIYKPSEPQPEISAGYARILARSGKRDEALQILSALGGDDSSSPQILDLIATIKAGRTPEPIASGAAAGVSEALFSLGSAILTSEPELGLAYFQLAAYLDDRSFEATVAVGDLLQSMNHNADAITLLRRVPASSGWYRRTQIKIASLLYAEERDDEAIATLKKASDLFPDDPIPYRVLGSILNGLQRWQDAATAYGSAIRLGAAAGEERWNDYYGRGVSYERLGRWPDAENDFKAALNIAPKQPQVLNYLGYSWADRGENLDEALAMLQRAVSLSNKSGDIVDSLGWAQYRLGKYPDAVTTLERAVNLKPSEPTIIDHLGDAYWRVGRLREARYQWSHVEDYDPEPALLASVKAKLKKGLVDGLAPVDTMGEMPAGTSLEVAAGESLWIIASRLYGNGALYGRILDANKDLIHDPNHLTPGMRLNIPDARTN